MVRRAARSEDGRVLEQEPGVIPTPATSTSRRKTHELEHFESDWAAVASLAAARPHRRPSLDVRRRSWPRTAPAPRGTRRHLGVQVTLRDCATNAPLGPPFNSLVTLHDGGTLSESAGSLAFAPGQRSPGHGAWTREARRTIAQRMVALILFDTPANLPGTPGFNPSLPVSPGFFAGWHTVTHTVRLTDADHVTSAGTNVFYKADGDVVQDGLLDGGRPAIRVAARGTRNRSGSTTESAE